MRHILALAAGLSMMSTLAFAQKEPKRPPLPAGADTNSANSYYQFGRSILTTNADKAADAFYWSTRLNPAMADGFYARRIALLLTDKRRLIRYWSGDRGTVQSNEIKRIDSLYYRALTINPFVSQTLDREIYEGVANEIAVEYERAGVAAGEVRFAIDREMAKASAATRAWMAYGDGRYADALQLYATAISGDKRNGPLRMERARVFFQMGKVDSALAEMSVAIEDLRKRDKKDLIYVYQSKALAEHSIGIAHLRLGHDDAAREAFGRALQEDLAYAPAHLELAYMMLSGKDTTGALAEMDLAVQVRADDPAAEYIYGFTLDAVGKAAEAEPHLRKAIRLDPVYALPHFALGSALEKLGRKQDALVEYLAFLDLAPRDDPRRNDATKQIVALTGHH